MMLLCGRYLLGLLLLLSITQSATGLWWRDCVLAQAVRPTVESVLGWRLNADVQIGALDISATRLQLNRLSIDKPAGYHVDIAETIVAYSWKGLLRRQLDSVRLHDPQVEISALPENSDNASTGFPELPPLEIADLRIVNGSVLLSFAEKPMRFAAIQVDLNGTRLPRFEASARLGEGDGLPITLAGTGNWDQRPGLTLSRLSWDGASLLDEPLQFQLDRSGAKVSGRVRLPRLNRTTLERMAGILSIPMRLPEKLDFSIEAPEIILSLQPGVLEIQLNIPEAEVQQDSTRLSLGAFYSNLSKKDATWTAAGRCTLAKTIQSTYTATYGADHQLRGEITGVIGDFAELLERFVPEWTKTVSGGLLLKGEFSSQEGKLVLNADLSGRPVAAAKKDYRLDIAPLRLQLSAEHSEAGLQGSGKVLLARRELLNFSADKQTWAFELNPISWQEIRPLAGPNLLPEAITDFSGMTAIAKVQYQGRDQWHGNVALAADRVQGPQIELTEVTANSRLGAQGKGIRLSDIRLNTRVTLPGGRFRLSGSGFATLEDSAFNVNLAALTLSEGEYFSTDGMSGLTGGTLLTSGALSGRLQNPQLDLDLKTGFGVAELLYGPYYAQLAGSEGQLGIRGTVDMESGRLLAKELTLVVPGLLTAQGEGTLGTEWVDFSGSLRSEELHKAFDSYFRQPLEAAASSFKDLQLSGILNGDFTVRKEAETFSVRGTLQPQGLGLQLPGQQLNIAGLHGTLPLAYGTSQELANEEPRPGELSFDTLKIGPLRFDNAPIQLQSSTNRLQVGVIPRGNLAEGQVRFADLEIGIEANQPRASARILVTGVNLEQLTRELSWPSLRGELSADLGEIEYASGELRSAGEATINAFGGSLVVSGIRVRDIGSPYQTLNGDIDLRGIDIYLLTRTLEFGEMNGILDGQIHNLRLFGTVPSAFDAELTTRDEGRRNISVKALNNLSILSQGGLSAALSQGIYQFIDFYRYQKIGIHCTLNNDIFRMTGSARDDSDEYLVYGGLLPPKIDIIAPGRDISFKEMLKRLSRLDRAGR